MKTFLVHSTATISLYTRVEAKTKREAIAEAAGRAVMGLCHVCAGDHGIAYEWVTSGELDGEPRDLRAEDGE